MKVAKLKKEHETFTVKWAHASGRQEEALKAICDKLEADLEIWEPRTKPISQRLNDIWEKRSDLTDELAQLQEELPNMESRERGEALRRVFKKVTLYWDKQFIPRSDKPTRPIKTDRPGRNSFTLLKKKIGWEFASPKLDGDW